MRLSGIFIVRAVALAGLAACVVSAIALWQARHSARLVYAQNFALVDDHGRPFEFSQTRGRPVVLFFGYTICPDICPTTLATLAHAKAAFGARGRDIVVLFVTVDPGRDTPAVLARYLALFDPSFVGLTGNVAQLAPVFSAYHVYHEVVHSTETASGYLVTHTATIYFIARDGHFQTYGDWTDSRDVLTRDLKEILS